MTIEIGKSWKPWAVLGVSLMLAGCGSGGGGTNNTGTVRFAALTSIPGWGSATNASFDLGTVDPATSLYYFTDRNNKAVDVIDGRSRTVVAQFQAGFAGAGASTSKSGPNGIDLIAGNRLAAGDVNSVKFLDRTTGALLSNVVVSASGLRADEGCFDPDDNIYMISSPEENPPFATFINTITYAIIAKVTFIDAAGAPGAGLEACFYDKSSKSFYVNNDGTTANPDGEVNVIPAASIAGLAGATVNYLTLAGLKAFPEGNCDPAGLVQGPGNDMAVSCRPAKGVALNFLIMDRTTGAILATVPMGGGDQIWYDPATNRYYSGASRWTANGLSPGSCSAATPCTPVVGVVDAATRALYTRIPTGNNAHSIAVDPVLHQAYSPISSPNAPAGCPDCGANGFTTAAVAVFTTQ